MDNNKWYALFVVQGKEFFVKDRIENLIRLGQVENVQSVLIPTAKEISEVRRKKIVKSVPLYSGYLFINGIVDGTNQSVLTYVTYVIKFLGCERPFPIPHREMQIIKAMSEDNRVRSAFSYTIGDIIEILGGHCKGLSGRIVDIVDINTLKVEIQIFNRIISTMIKLEDAKVA
jgi:transcription antitermination factor NusG